MLRKASAVGDIGGHRAARGDDRIAADLHRRYQSAVRSDERVIADLGLIFEIAVIVAGDRARADVRAGSHSDVAQIGQMVRLGSFAEHRFLRFDEIADLRLFAEDRAGAQACERANLAARADDGAFDMAIRADLHIV